MVRIKFCFGLTLYNKCIIDLQKFYGIGYRRIGQKLPFIYKHLENDSISVCGIQILFRKKICISNTLWIQFVCWHSRRVSGQVTKQKLIRQYSKIYISSNTFIYIVEKCNKNVCQRLKNVSTGSISSPWPWGCWCNEKSTRPESVSGVTVNSFATNLSFFLCKPFKEKLLLKVKVFC